MTTVNQGQQKYSSMESTLVTRSRPDSAYSKLIEARSI